MMTVRRKTLLVIGATLLVLSGVLFATSRFLLLPGLSRPDEHVTREDVERAVGVLARELEGIEEVASYCAVRGPGRWSGVSARDLLSHFRLDLIIQVDVFGRVAAMGAFDRLKGQEVPVPAGVAKHLVADGVLLRQSGEKNSVRGIIGLPEGAMLVASHAVTSGEKGTVQGTVIVGRYLDEGEVSRLNGFLKSSFTVEPWRRARLPLALDDGDRAALEQNHIVIRALNDKKIAGFALIRDVNRKPVLLLRTARQRRSLGEGRAGVFHFMLFMAAVGLVFAALTVLLLEILVHSRLDRLSEGVRRVALSGDLSTRIAMSGSDELSGLAGRINGMLSALERTQHGMKRSEERYRQIVDTAHEGIWVQDARGETAYINQRMAEMLGYTREEIRGRAFTDFVERSHQMDGERFFDRLKLDGISKQDLLFRRKDGSELWAIVSGTPMRGSDGALAGSLCMIVDITERKRAEQGLQQAKEGAERANRELERSNRELERAIDHARQMALEAEAANNAKSQFLANMSHEIRTPMNGIIGMTQLAMDTDLTAEQEEYLAAVNSSAQALLSLINDILDFSKIEAGRLRLDPIGFRLRDAVGDSLKSMAVRADERGLELTYHVDAEVPDAVVGDVGRLRQIMVNLVGNAIKFTEKGEVVVIVSTESGDENEILVRFSVQDTGIGIPDEKQKMIFDSFSQADGSTTRRYGGTGLGLAICKQLVGLMGGRLWLESEDGGGSTFHFTVRLAVQDSDSASAGKAAQEVDLGGRAVLVVDDNDTNREILMDEVREWEMRPTGAPGGEAALGLMKEARDRGQAFPLVLLDATMPGMDGFALAEAIEQNPDLAGATIMMLTAAGQRGDGARCRQLGISAYLTKPIRQSDLKCAIVAVLNDRDGKTLVTRHTLRESRARLRVLLVEDNPLNQRVATRLLERMNYDVTVVNNGREGLEALEKEDFDIVLMDLQMPELDGFEATAAIREKERETGEHMPIVALTAHAMKGDRERCLEAGMDGYVTKPIDAGKLGEVIDGLATGAGRGGATLSEDDLLPFDHDAALGQMAGDEELLREAAEVFLESCPALAAELADAVARRDCAAVVRAAVAIKGSLDHFAAKRACEAAERLQRLAREGKIQAIERAWEKLEAEIERVAQSLAVLAGEREA